MKTLEKFSSFNKSLNEQELNCIKGGDYSYTRYFGDYNITYWHMTLDNGTTQHGSVGFDSGGNMVQFKWSD